MPAASRTHAWINTAAALGVTKPFIYTHFRSKTELLAALCTPTIELSLEAVANAAKGPGTPTQRLYRAVIDFTKVVLQAASEHRHLLPRGKASGARGTGGNYVIA